MASEPTAGAPSTVLTRRGRLVVGILLTLTTAAVVVALQALVAKSTPAGGDELTGRSRGASAAGSTSPAGEPALGRTAASAPPAGASPYADTSSAAPTAVATNSPPVIANDRVQPPRVTVPLAASGQLVGVSGSTPAVSGKRVWTYRVEVEQGLPFDGGEFATAVHATLSDPRGWATRGNAFQRLDTEGTDFRVVLASPALTDRLCAPLRTRGEVSCRNGDLVVLNALRWAEGIPGYADDLASYREYMVNHEVGHRLGHGHVDCTGSGDPAPVMMQQTYGLDGCQPNPWPLPGE